LPGQPAAGGPPQLLAVVDHAVEDPARIPRAVQLVAVQAADPGLTDQEVLGAAAVIALELLVVLERAAVGTLRLVDVADGQEDVLDVLRAGPQLDVLLAGLAGRGVLAEPLTHDARVDQGVLRLLLLPLLVALGRRRCSSATATATAAGGG